eukprot:COSAG03_NODE_16416_length_402_cov_1.359736_2_plen_64_part_01
MLPLLKALIEFQFLSPVRKSHHQREEGGGGGGREREPLTFHALHSESLLRLIREGKTKGGADSL